MRHLSFIIGIYEMFGKLASEKTLTTVFNVAKQTARLKTLAQFQHCDLLWSVRYEEEYLRVSISNGKQMISIYDGKEYQHPVMEVINLEK